MRNFIVSTLLVCSLIITGAFAYLTATDTAKNMFTVGSVKAQLTEPNWNPDYDSNNDGINDTLLDIIPGETISKDPTIQNTGKNNAYVYMLVEMPKGYKVDIKNQNGEITTESHYPLFSFEANNNWSLINSQTNTQTDAYDYYLYAYDTSLAPGESATLFDNIKFALTTSDISENNITAKTIEDLNVNITGYAIQSDFWLQR
jgi:predicted ribosomally synthesized peptide with SipW-like signal peptide